MMRIDKYLAHCGYGSRTEVKKIIKNKLVFCNEVLVTKDDLKINPEIDEIIVEGERSSYQQYVYIMLNKPAGYISSNYDPIHKVTKELIKEFDYFQTFPVGRLDLDTEGLLLLSNDGKLAHDLLSPRKHVDKMYYVEFSGTYREIYTSLFESGITLEDGYLTMPAKIELLADNKANLTIQEGKYHQVKRMFEALDMKVTYLKRMTFGPLRLDPNLKKGSYRLLSDDEVLLLKNHKEA